VLIPYFRTVRGMESGGRVVTPLGTNGSYSRQEPG
jgi:hypothetical protein